MNKIKQTLKNNLKTLAFVGVSFLGVSYIAAGCNNNTTPIRSTYIVYDSASDRYPENYNPTIVLEKGIIEKTFYDWDNNKNTVEQYVQENRFDGTNEIWVSKGVKNCVLPSDLEGVVVKEMTPEKQDSINAEYTLIKRFRDIQYINIKSLDSIPDSILFYME